MLLLLGFALLLALMLLLVLLAAIGLGPGKPGSLGPLPTPPHFDAAVGNGIAADREPALAVGGAQVAPSGSGVTAARVVADGDGPAAGGTSPASAVAPARAVQVAVKAPGPTPAGPAPQSAEAQPVAAVPAPAASPPSAVVSPVPAGGGTPSGPISAGVIPPEEPAEACEGTEYAVAVAFDVEAIFGGAEDAEIVLRRVGSDGSEVELRMQGGIADLNALLGQFAAEGPCVTVVVEPLVGEDGAVAEPEAPDAEPPAAEAPSPTEPEPQPVAP